MMQFIVIRLLPSAPLGLSIARIGGRRQVRHSCASDGEYCGSKSRLFILATSSRNRLWSQFVNWRLGGDFKLTNTVECIVPPATQAVDRRQREEEQAIN